MTLKQNLLKLYFRHWRNEAHISEIIRDKNPLGYTFEVGGTLSCE